MVCTNRGFGYRPFDFAFMQPELEALVKNLLTAKSAKDANLEYGIATALPEPYPVSSEQKNTKLRWPRSSLALFVFFVD